MENMNEEFNESTVPEYESADTENVKAEAAAPEAEEFNSPVEGEYHFVKPQRNLYEDAEFVRTDESAEIPNYYVPSEKKPKEKSEPKDGKKKHVFLKAACLCLVCALLGGLAGSGATLLIQKNNSGDAETAAAPITTVSTEKTTGNANDIYALGCEQVVGITTSVNYSNMFGQSSSATVSGSGFVVTTDGYILTNYHVIEYAYEGNSTVTVMFKDGTAYEAAIVGVEDENDLAVLKIDATDLTPVTVGDSSSIQVGDTVYAIGNPLGELDFSMTTGSVSALDRSIVTEVSDFAINMFQFDAAVNSGNSGGPVYNTAGQVIGIVTAKSAVDGTEGLGFAIPINDAVEIANELITNGYVSGKAYMGVSIDSRFSSVYADYYNIPEGAYVYSVVSGSCADEAGLRAGDIITKLGDTDISEYSDLTSALRHFKAGDTAEVCVYRDNDYVTLTITFDEATPETGEQNSAESGFNGYSYNG